jgi:hypothetical protein
MSFRVIQDLPIGKLENAVPTAYRAMSDALPNKTAIVTLILFRSSKGDVILSRTAKRALEKIPKKGQETRIAIGGCFTAEAEALLKKYAFEVLCLSDLHWTDDAYISLRGAPRDVDMEL